jgi:hypothetical protein
LRSKNLLRFADLSLIKKELFACLSAFHSDCSSRFAKLGNAFPLDASPTSDRS